MDGAVFNHPDWVFVEAVSLCATLSMLVMSVQDSMPIQAGVADEQLLTLVQ
jgi:hypothetical protein